MHTQRYAGFWHVCKCVTGSQPAFIFYSQGQIVNSETRALQAALFDRRNEQ